MLKTQISLDEIYVPIDDCMKVRLGLVKPEDIDELTRRHFDQAPVVDKRGQVLGTITVVELKRLLESNEPLSADNHAIDKHRLSVQPSLGDLLKALTKRQATIITSLSGEAVGLLTISDLNNPSFRAFLYPWLIRLEIGLSKMIARKYPEQWDWIRYLPEHSQVSIVGYWKLTERRNVEANALHACTVTDLIRVLAADNELRRTLGYAGEKEAAVSLGQLPVLRNGVMHPVKPLILAPTDVKKLAERVTCVENLLNRINSLPPD